MNGLGFDTAFSNATSFVANPITRLLIAAALGFVLGMMLRKSSAWGTFYTLIVCLMVLGTVALMGLTAIHMMAVHSPVQAPVVFVGVAALVGSIPGLLLGGVLKSL